MLYDTTGLLIHKNIEVSVFCKELLLASRLLVVMEEHAPTPKMDLHATVQEDGGGIHVKKVCMLFIIYISSAI